MTISAEALFGPTQLNNVTTSVYAVPANGVVQINKVTVTNIATVTRLFSVWIVRSGTSANTANLLVKAKPISAGQSMEVFELSGVVLEAGDNINMSSDATVSINAVGSGYSIQ